MLKKPENSCEKIEVYKHLMTLCDRDISVEPVDVDEGIGACPICKSAVGDWHNFCHGCGKRLDWSGSDGQT